MNPQREIFIVQNLGTLLSGKRKKSGQALRKKIWFVQCDFHGRSDSSYTYSSAHTLWFGVCVQHPILLKGTLFPNHSKPPHFQRMQVSFVNQVVQSLHDTVANIPQLNSLTSQTDYFKQDRKVMNEVCLISFHFLLILPCFE